MKFYNVSFSPNGIEPRCGLNMMIYHCQASHEIAGPMYRTLRNARSIVKVLQNSNPTYFQDLKIHKVKVEEIQ